jgi:hypothetical protein
MGQSWRAYWCLAWPEYFFVVCPTQSFQRSLIPGARARQWRQTLNRFQVVIVNVRPGIEHDFDAPILGVKIGHEHFNHRGIGILPMTH